jgi:altronate dehydratase
MRRLLILDPRDNIAVCLADIPEGEIVRQDDLTLPILNSIPRGHKVAIADIPKGSGVIKYGERMGHATTDISQGEHVHVHNVLGDRLSTEKK